MAETKKPINEYFSGLPQNTSPSSATNLVVEENGVAKKVPFSSLPSGGSGGGASIIYATEKPSTPQQAIYVITEDEVVKGEFVLGGAVNTQVGHTEIVDVLPETPESMMDFTTETIYAYYLTTDGIVYGYADADTSVAMGIPEGWNDISVVGCLIINSLEEADIDMMCLLLTKQPKTRVYVPMQDGTFLELTSGIRTRFDQHSGNVSITEM